MENQFSLNETDLCVMCGMCIPHCPTYRIYQLEAESPRGRIALMQALNRKEIDIDSHLAERLNHCLSCLACEAICPSKVPFGKLIDSARAQLEPFIEKPASLKRLLRMSENPATSQRYGTALNFAKKPGLNQLINLGLKLFQPENINAGSIIKQADAAKFNSRYKAKSETKGSVALFTGCMGKTFDVTTLENSIKVLTHIGFDVLIPEKQHCCGALHQHNGEIETANHLAEKNQQVFDLDIERILYSATGCGAQLNQHDLPKPATEITSFIFEQLGESKPSFKSLDASIVVHQSCSSRNNLKLTNYKHQLLELIPGLKVVEIAHADLCCGAGGSHQITYPDLSNELLNLKLSGLEQINPKYLLSDNLGCSLHFKSGLEKINKHIEVIHPISLLANQLI